MPRVAEQRMIGQLMIISNKSLRHHDNLLSNGKRVTLDDHLIVFVIRLQLRINNLVTFLLAEFPSVARSSTTSR